MSDFRYIKPYDGEVLPYAISGPKLTKYLRDELAAFNEERRRQLGNKPIDREGEPELLPPWGTPGGMGPEPRKEG